MIPLVIVALACVVIDIINSAKYFQTPWSIRKTIPWYIRYMPLVGGFACASKASQRSAPLVERPKEHQCYPKDSQ